MSTMRDEQQKTKLTVKANALQEEL